jgi:hypothetical protein
MCRRDYVAVVFGCVDGILPGSPATQPHFIRRHKAEALVKAPTIVRGVKDDAPDAALGERIQDRTHQRFGDAAPPPGGLNIDVEDDRFGPELQVVSARAGAREDRSKLDTGTSYGCRRRPVVRGDPGQVLPTWQGIAQVRGSCPLQYLLVVRCQPPHIPKHRRAVVCKERNIGRVSLAHGEHWLRAGHVVQVRPSLLSRHAHFARTQADYGVEMETRIDLIGQAGSIEVDRQALVRGKLPQHSVVFGMNELRALGRP